ncbi:MAG: hypothetical protein AAF602_07460 [Myxococcota bacterium]
MRISLPLAVFACSPGPETPVPEAVEPPTMVPDAEAPTSLLPESNVRLRAEFHIDETTGLPGSWTDEDGETRPAELEIIVGDDTYNGVDGTFCRVLVPLDPRRTTLRGGLETGQLWGVDFTAERSAITTDCDEPAFEPISRFYDDDVVGFMTTNQDGSPVTWSIVLEAPSSTDIAWLEGPWLDGDAVIGGQMWLSDRVSAGGPRRSRASCSRPTRMRR